MRRILRIASRECGFFIKNPIYLWCMVIFPIALLFLFTSIMGSGQPVEMPVGVVDFDNSTMSRSLIRRLDSFESSKVVAHYPSINEARNAIQRNKIFGYLVIPANMSSDLTSARHPKISFYYSYTSLMAGTLVYRDMKTLAKLGSAAVGNAKMTAQGLTPTQTQTFLQPIVIDTHPLVNPWIDYNMYLSNMLIPTAFMLFVFLISAYAVGTEIKFGSSREWMEMAGGNIYIALIGKFLPHMIVSLCIWLGFDYYIFGVLHFNHLGSVWMIIANTVLTLMASMAFGIFAFGLIPSLRLSMSVCSLWGVLSFTTVGTAFPLSAMDTPIQALALLFPIRHYYMIYQICVLNGFPWTDALLHFGALALFILLPLFFVGNIRKALLEYEYMP